MTKIDLSKHDGEIEEKHLGNPADVTELNMSYNDIREVDILEKFVNLEVLDLSYNKIRVIPTLLFQLPKLKRINLRCNLIKKIPPCIHRAKQLENLDLSYNKIGDLPDELDRMEKLVKLDLRHNLFHDFIGLWPFPTSLRKVFLDGNGLKTPPAVLGKLPELREIRVKGNPLQFPPEEVVSRGDYSILSFIKNLEKDKAERHDVKLILLGDGGEGKTCLSRALRGESFMNSPATNGIEIRNCQIKHPKYEIPFEYHIWDFEGQEINHQSHQFFLTRKAVYILVINGRRPIRESVWEYWLSTIAQRAPGVRVLVVFTECEKRTPVFDPDDMRSRFEELLADDQFHFFVGCENGKHIDDLKKRIVDLTVELKMAPREWPKSYLKAEQLIEGLVKQGEFAISREKLNQVLETCGIPKPELERASRLLANIGVFTHFPDSLALRDFIVLDPEWLTTAVSLVMENKRLMASNGELTGRLLQMVWGIQVKYKAHLRELYLAMKEFELCYSLANNEKQSYVPLRFPAGKTKIPWRLSVEGKVKERVIEYRFTNTPPAGLMSRFIVKNHPYIVQDSGIGVYWRNGVFLRTETHGVFSEALCEYNQERRWLRFTVRAAYPENLAEQLHEYISAIFGLFKGMDYKRYYGCLRSNGSTCKGFHSESMLAMTIARQFELPCEEGRHQVKPDSIVKGFHSFGESNAAVDHIYGGEASKTVNEAFDTFGQGFRAIWTRMGKISKLQLAEREEPGNILRMQQVFREFFNRMDMEEENETPCMFTLALADQKMKWNLQTYKIRFFCEDEQLPHPYGWQTRVRFTEDQWRDMAPYLRVLVGLMVANLPIKSHLEDKHANDLKPKWGSVKEEIALIARVKNEIEESITKKGKRRGLLDYISSDSSQRKKSSDEMETDYFLNARRVLAEAMAKRHPEAYKNRDYGGLVRLLAPNGGYRWLCPHHAQKFFSEMKTS